MGCKSDLRPASANVAGPGDSSGSGSSTMGNGGMTGGMMGNGEGGGFVTTEQGRRVAQQIGAREYKECSALKVEGVDDVFEAATRASMLIRDHGRTHGQRKSKRDGRSREDDAGGCCVVV